MDGQTAVLDMLFDTCDGVLKEELPEIQTLDFSSLGLLTGDFNDSLFDGLLADDDKLALQNNNNTATTAYTDHDYVMQPVLSPSSSDSGVSIDSGSSLSPRCDMSHTDASSVSGSPPSVTQLSPGMSVMTEPSPTAQVDHLDPLGLENFDIDDIADMDFDTIDTSAFLGETPTEEKDVSIDLGNHSDLMTFDTSLSTSLGMDGSRTKTVKIIKVSADSLPFTMKDVSTDTQRSAGTFPELRLTEEEKDLLSREGVTLPTNMPLTKEEERALKGVRRKIRNKISAKESRKRKMGYVDGLEKRVKICTQENQSLQKKVDTLEKQNTTLMTQMRKLQSLLNLRSTRTTQASTCVVVLLLSFAFLVVPNFNPFKDQDSMENVKSIPIGGKSRNLLQHSTADDLSDTDPYGITVRPGPFWENPPKTPVMPELDGKNIIVDDEESSINKDVQSASDGISTGNDDAVKQKVVYVQIEKDITETNVTYVSSEAEFKPVEPDGFHGNLEQTREQAVEVGEGPAGKKKRHDL